MTDHTKNTTEAEQRSERWRSFHDRFMGLAQDEQRRSDIHIETNGEALLHIKVLRAEGKYYRERVFVAEEQRRLYKSFGRELTPEELSKIEAKMLEENKAGVNAPETGRWTYGPAVSEYFLARVRRCIWQAGRALPDYQEGTNPEDFWLHRLWNYFWKNRSELLDAADDTGGTIRSVCVASAAFCGVQLDELAVQQSANAENSSKIEQTAESRPEVLIPPKWEELRKRGSITIREAAEFLRCHPKTVKRLVDANELKRSANKRIICNELLRHQIRNVHGPQVLL